MDGIELPPHLQFDQTPTPGSFMLVQLTWDAWDAWDDTTHPVCMQAQFKTHGGELWTAIMRLSAMWDMDGVALAGVALRDAPTGGSWMYVKSSWTTPYHIYIYAKFSKHTGGDSQLSEWLLVQTVPARPPHPPPPRPPPLPPMKSP